jgi:hypothetical protein
LIREGFMKSVIDTRDSINPHSTRVDVVGGRRRRLRLPFAVKVGVLPHSRRLSGDAFTG